MELVLHFVFSDSVLLLNGSFAQSAAAVRYDSAEPLFVTVLPLNAVYLPYTVELVGGKAVRNGELTLCADMGDGHCYIELLPRSAFVYAPASPPPPAKGGVAQELLTLVQKGNLAAARALLTDELSETVTDEALRDFFTDVRALRENTFTPQKGYLLIKEDGSAARCTLTLRGGRIDNIEM